MLSVKKQVIIHSLLVLCITGTIIMLFFSWSSPITPSHSLLPQHISPVLQVLSILLLAVGLPYFLLSTTSTLLQRWFSLLQHEKSPYPLYSLSNAGSLLAIVSYPFIIEPYLSLHIQGYFWSVTFVIVGILLIVCTIHIFLLKKLPAVHVAKENAVKHSPIRLSWLYLPAVSSIMLLAGTHQLTQGIAPIPFLWLLPLGLYLLSFILCFSEGNYYKRSLYAYMFLLSLPVILARLMQPPLLGVLTEVVLFGILLFSCFMICHGELFARRPAPKYLNIFYLANAFGSVIGAIIVAIIAPLFFIGLLWEFLLGLFFTTLIITIILVNDKNSLVYRKLQTGTSSDKELRIFVIAVVSIFYVIISLASFAQQTAGALGIWRNFYGTLRVTQQQPETRCLINGKIIHGCQPVKEQDRMRPTTYFGENSVGVVVDSLRMHTDQPLRIGTIGLGVGTIAAYGQKGDVVKFYELNPLDVTVAKEYFTYLKDTRAKVETVVGDGRLSLEKELQTGNKQNFHVFIMDAFNDDAIPVHLLTKEAFAVYKAHLAEDSIIAVHISNSYLDLTPVVLKAAEYYNMHAVGIDAPPVNNYQTRSKWVLLSTNKNLLTTKKLQATKKLTSDRNIRLWTDDYSNLFQIFRYD